MLREIVDSDGKRDGRTRWKEAKLGTRNSPSSKLNDKTRVKHIKKHKDPQSHKETNVHGNDNH